MEAIFKSSETGSTVLKVLSDLQKGSCGIPKAVSLLSGGRRSVAGPAASASTCTDLVDFLSEPAASTAQQSPSQQTSPFDDPFASQAPAVFSPTRPTRRRSTDGNNDLLGFATPGPATVDAFASPSDPFAVTSSSNSNVTDMFAASADPFAAPTTSKYCTL